MPSPQNNQELPDPDETWKTEHSVDASSSRSLVKQARKWRPFGRVVEIAAATVSRFAMRLIDRSTGKAFSADELASNADSPLKLTPGTTAPTNGVDATLTTGSSDAGITWTAASAGTEGNSITVVTTDNASSAETTVSESATAITVTRAAKARMQIAANFGSGVENVELDPVFPPTGSGYREWGKTVGTDYYYLTTQEGGGSAQLGKVDTTVPTADGLFTFASGEDEWPDTIDWSGAATTNGATGTPTVTAASSSASQVKTAADASLSLVTTTLTGDGSDTFAAVSPAQSLAGGLDTTATPPHIRVASGNLYVQEAGVWKEVSLSALS